MPDAAIRLSGVTKRFRDKTAVNTLDLVVPTGSLCGFLGPNGAGKTTTIRMIMSIFYPTEGSISVLDKASAIESKDRIGYLPEERGVYRKMKVGEFLRYIAKLKGVEGGRSLSRKIDDWLERVELPETRKKRCEELSKGMQQKIQFLAAIIHDPELIILDEPFSGLDPVNARLLRDLIDELHSGGRTIIFSTHVLHQAEQICDRVFMINRGRKVLDGSVAGVREQFNPRTVIVEPAANGHAPADFAESLQRIDGVHSVTHPERESYYELHVSEGHEPASIMRHAMDVAEMRRVETRRASLEDIFISLIDPGDSEDSIRAALRADAAGGDA